MAYAVISDLVLAAGGKGLVELADDDGDGRADQALIDRAIAQASSYIDGYARRLYDVPFTPVPQAITSLVADEAVYLLKAWKRVTAEEDHRLREEREKTLASLQSGKWNPVELDPYPIGGGGGTPVVVEVQNRGDFSRRGTRGWW